MKTNNLNTINKHQVIIFFLIFPDEIAFPQELDDLFLI